MNATDFDGKLALQQRVLTAYRAPFFDALARACLGGLSVCAGLPRLEESIAVTDQLRYAEFVSVQNMHLFRGPFYLCYQRGLPAWLERCGIWPSAPNPCSGWIAGSVAELPRSCLTASRKFTFIESRRRPSGTLLTMEKPGRS